MAAGHGVKKTINDIESWPPGTFMKFEAVERIKVKNGNIQVRTFKGIGLVVSNDGISQIAVIWGSNCAKMFNVYDVTALNARTVSVLE